eukprot:CAMPEP_0196654544 /NCGR_PEP_ID=MMETSP1086-20130531/4260_1 /TAXON_ID=77921 /ORGANISM="Cyanoptyche  gloeocystis , Strain SAG4.97" /LENGTH=456 /DNA_ID=CAMNT_0041986377 /DNA_START=151 /DNA_END=1521 /DNA_ORIENTATION=-
MTPALGFFYGGLCNAENVLNTIMMCFVCMSLVTLQWLFVGYSFAFGPGNKAFGSFQWGGLVKVSHFEPVPQYMPTVPHLTFATFQVMFAQITPALISGSIVGRMKFGSFIIFVLIWTTACYDLLAHFVWSWRVDDTGAVVCEGWLCQLGAIDFAGGTVIHITSGISGLVASLIVGRRRNAEAMTPHNQPMVVTGAALLWFGWFGFNAGSAGAANGIATIAFMNTHIAASTALLCWIVLEWIFEGHPTATGASIGAVVGLVAITPACGYITCMASVSVGAFGVACSYTSLWLKRKYKFDDTLDVFCCHGVGGIAGAIATGCWANFAVNPYIPLQAGQGMFYPSIHGVPQGMLLGFQLAAICTAVAIAGSVTAVTLLLMKYTIGIRVDEDAESMGLDRSVHGGDGYSLAAILPLFGGHAGAHNGEKAPASKGHSDVTKIDIIGVDPSSDGKAGVVVTA